MENFSNNIHFFRKIIPTLALCLVINGCTSLIYEPFASGHFSPRTNSAKETEDSDDQLLAKGYIKIGTIRVIKGFGSCGDMYGENYECQSKVRNDTPTYSEMIDEEEIGRKAADKGGDIWLSQGCSTDVQTGYMSAYDKSNPISQGYTTHNYSYVCRFSVYRLGGQ